MTLKIHLYCLRSIPLKALSSRVISVFEFRGLHIGSSNWNCLVISLYVSLLNWVSYSLAMPTVFLWMVHCYSVYSYVCTFWYSDFNLWWFHIILYSIANVNFSLVISHFEHLFLVYYLCHHWICLYRLWNNCIMRFIFWPTWLFDYFDLFHLFVTNVH